jgi:hypothetical protein
VLSVRYQTDSCDEQRRLFHRKRSVNFELRRSLQQNTESFKKDVHVVKPTKPMRSHAVRMTPIAVILMLNLLASGRQSNQAVSQSPAEPTPGTNVALPTAQRPTAGPSAPSSTVSESPTPPARSILNTESTTATAKPKTSRGPLSDYVPCLFSSDDQWQMRALDVPPSPPAAVPSPQSQSTQTTTTQTIDFLTALKLVEAVNSAIQRFGDESGTNVTVFQEAFNQALDVKKLVGEKPEEAYATIHDAVVAANRRINISAYFRQNPPADKLDAAAASILRQLQSAVAEAATQVVASTQTKAKPFQPPEDVSCSMSVMTWKETSDVFGRRVANTFVAVQVTVRNLNTKNEFLIHDIQVAIDTGISSEAFAWRYFGRFQAGRDKLLVRAVAQRGQSEDRRNLALHALQAVGAIAGASSITAGTTQFKDAVAVFQGAFIPGFTTLFPDHTVEQLNHINDLVFSASNTSKVLVPIQGSVPLVTFVSEKPIEELPFAWCGYPSRGGLFHKQSSQKLHQHCEFDTFDSYPDDASKGWDDLRFKDWKAAALRVLQGHTFVVIGGVHIQEVAKVGKISNLDCPNLTSGSIDISQTKDGVVTCSVTGEGLDKVNSVKLEKGTDKISGKIKPAKDANSATLQFDPEKLSDGEGTYSLYMIDSASTETDSGESVSLSKQPFIKDVKDAATNDATALDVSKAPPTLTLEGKNLGLLSAVYLVPDDGGSAIQGQIPTINSGDTSVSISFTSDSWVTGKQYHLRYSIKAEPSKQINSTLAVKTTGTPPKPPAAKPTGTPPKAPAAKPSKTTPKKPGP